MNGVRTKALPPELAHLLGDYVVQSDWMATEKTTHWGPAIAHAASYSACFLPITRSWKALAVIGVSHAVIDRLRLAKYLVWASNQVAPRRYQHRWNIHVSATGYHMPEPGEGMFSENCQRQGKPLWLTVWLMIIQDNTLHLLINRWALRRWGPCQRLTH